MDPIKCISSMIIPISPLCGLCSFCPRCGVSDNCFCLIRKYSTTNSSWFPRTTEKNSPSLVLKPPTCFVASLRSNFARQKNRPPRSIPAIITTCLATSADQLDSHFPRHTPCVVRDLMQSYHVRKRVHVHIQQTNYDVGMLGNFFCCVVVCIWMGSSLTLTLTVLGRMRLLWYFLFPCFQCSQNFQINLFYSSIFV